MMVFLDKPLLYRIKSMRMWPKREEEEEEEEEEIATPTFEFWFF